MGRRRRATHRGRYGNEPRPRAGSGRPSAWPTTLDLPPAERVELTRAHVDDVVGDRPGRGDRARGPPRARGLRGRSTTRSGSAGRGARLVIPLLMQARDEEAEQAGRTAVETLEPLGEREELADALHRLGWYLWRRGRNEEAEPLLRRAVEMAERVDCAARPRASRCRRSPSASPRSGRSAEALETIEEAYRLAKEVGDFSNLMRATTTCRRSSRTRPPTTSGREAVLREGLELAQRGGRDGARRMADREPRRRPVSASGSSRRPRRCSAGRSSSPSQVGDEPLRGMRLTALAARAPVRGRIDEAEAIHRGSIPILNANPEPQSQIFIPLDEAYLALARGETTRRRDRFAETVEQLRASTSTRAPEAFTERRARAPARRAGARRPRRTATCRERGRLPGRAGERDARRGPPRGRSGRGATTARRRGRELEALGLRIDAARRWSTSARAMARLGEDPRATLERARAILLECDARVFLFEVDDALAELEP